MDLHIQEDDIFIQYYTYVSYLIIALRLLRATKYFGNTNGKNK